MNENFSTQRREGAKTLGVRYVAGFMFTFDRDRVALIRKQKPVWQRGKLNGIGGKVEPGETAVQAMVREFQEETGYQTGEEMWSHFCAMHGENDGGEDSFHVDFFATTGAVSFLRSPEEEQIELILTDHINVRRNDMVENLPWLIALAIDHIHDGRPSMVTASYGKGTVTG